MSTVIDVSVEGQEAFEWEGSEEEIAHLLDELRKTAPARGPRVPAVALRLGSNASHLLTFARRLFRSRGARRVPALRSSRALCPPKAEVTGSNPVGRANNFNALANAAHPSCPINVQ